MRLCPAVLVVQIFAVPGAAQTLFGPSPYLQASDSPFAAAGPRASWVLEDLEDARFDIRGVRIARGVGVCISPTQCFNPASTDSVDADDGVIDGRGNGGHSLWAEGPTGFRFEFDPLAIGGLPTAVGVVWTDGEGTTTFTAFGPRGAQIGAIGPVAIADGSFLGTTAEDRFFGIEFGGGIQAIEITNTRGGIEIDHLQYTTELAVSSRVGTGCGGAPPDLDVSRPVVGSTLGFTIQRARPHAPGLALLGNVRTTPGSVGAGCSLWVASAAVLSTFTADGAGGWSLSLPLPPIPELGGIPFASQVAMFDTLVPGSFDLSNGVVARIGLR